MMGLVRRPPPRYRAMTTDFPALHDHEARGFASDNQAGIHPEVLAAIATANGGHQIAYGDDAYTARLQEVIKARFGERAEAYPVFNGFGVVHHAQPRAVSIAQVTEVGTVYTPEEIAAVCAHAHGLGMVVHMDGA